VSRQEPGIPIDRAAFHYELGCGIEWIVFDHAEDSVWPQDAADLQRERFPVRLTHVVVYTHGRREIKSGVAKWQDIRRLLHKHFESSRAPSHFPRRIAAGNPAEMRPPFGEKLSLAAANIQPCQITGRKSVSLEEVEKQSPFAAMKEVVTRYEMVTQRNMKEVFIILRVTVELGARFHSFLSGAPPKPSGLKR